MLLWQIRLVAGVAILAALWGGYWWVGYNAVEQYKDAQKIVQAEADKVQQTKYDKLAAEYEIVKGNREIVYKTLARTVERIVKEPAYQVPCITQEGVEAANKALQGGTQ